MGFQKVNFIRKRVVKGLVIGLSVLMFVLVIAYLSVGSTEEEKLPTFGSGPVLVRLYTDYFCPPCSAMESAIEPLILTLVKQGLIKVVFVDTPFHRFTPLYASYFLKANAAKGDIDHALRVRRLLFEAAANKSLTTEVRLMELFQRESIPIREINEKAVFDFFNSCIKEDNIDATPSCVIVKGGKKEKFVGGPDIVRALRAIGP
ncbi:MAG: DsbA family protein [Syntrophales bacterium]|nr:DsbA family protein [Syntrophales bacterium]